MMKILIVITLCVVCFFFGVIAGAKKFFPYLHIRKTSDWVRARVSDLEQEQSLPVVVVQGDSLIARGEWSLLREAGFAVVNAGAGGLKTTELDLTWLESSPPPKAIVLWCGLNDLSKGRSVLETKERLEELTKLVLSKGIQLYVLSLPETRNTSAELVASVRIFNSLTEKSLTAMGAEWLNCEDYFGTPGALSRKDSLDGVHFTVCYYERLSENLGIRITSR